jgi:hypothetical protein
MVDFPFEINYKEIIRCEGLMECTRDLARTLNHNPYITFGDYMNELPSSMLEQLLLVAESEENDHFDELLLISEMLARAEGLDASQTEEQSITRLKVLMSILAVEGLYRRGLIRAFRENYSFGEDMMNKVVAKRLNDDS